MTQLILVRHGLTKWNASHRFQGQTDISLNETGRRQVAALGQRLASEHIDALYTSDLKRARQTAEAIAAHHTVDPYPEARLREISFGQWEGLTYIEISQRDPHALAAWQEDIGEVAPPGGESLKQLALRVQSVLENIHNHHAGESVLLVAHGGTLQVAICLTLGLPLGMYWQFHLAPASISRIAIYPQGAILNGLNDTCHLSGGNL